MKKLLNFIWTLQSSIQKVTEDIMIKLARSAKTRI